MVICGTCGKEIPGMIYFCRLNEIYKKNNIHGNWCRVVFCSDRCRALHEGHVHPFICHYCGKKSRNRLTFNNNNYFCSEECLIKFIEENSRTRS